MSSDRDAIQAAYDELDAAPAKVAALTYDTLTHPELLALLDRRERTRRREQGKQRTPVLRGEESVAPQLGAELRNCDCGAGRGRERAAGAGRCSRLTRRRMELPPPEAMRGDNAAGS